MLDVERPAGADVGDQASDPAADEGVAAHEVAAEEIAVDGDDGAAFLADSAAGDDDAVLDDVGGFVAPEAAGQRLGAFARGYVAPRTAETHGLSVDLEAHFRGGLRVGGVGADEGRRLFGQMRAGHQDLAAFLGEIQGARFRDPRRGACAPGRQ